MNSSQNQGPQIFSTTFSRQFWTQAPRKKDNNLIKLE
jgi:hypothetical protein